MVRLDRAVADPTELRAELERRLGVRVTAVSVQELNLVNETTLVDVRYTATGRPVPVEPTLGRLDLQAVPR